MEKLKAMIRKMVQEEGFSRGSRKDKEAAKSRSTVLGMIQVEEEEAPSFDMSKTSDRGDGNYVSLLDFLFRQFFLYIFLTSLIFLSHHLYPLMPYNIHLHHK